MPTFTTPKKTVLPIYQGIDLIGCAVFNELGAIEGFVKIFCNCNYKTLSLSFLCRLGLDLESFIDFSNENEQENIIKLKDLQNYGFNFVIN